MESGMCHRILEGEEGTSSNHAKNYMVKSPESLYAVSKKVLLNN